MLAVAVAGSTPDFFWENRISRGSMFGGRKLGRDLIVFDVQVFTK